MTFNYLFNSYTEEELEQMRMGTNPLLPPHLLIEVHYAGASVTGLQWCVRQMGTQRRLDNTATREEAIESAIAIAKQMIPNGVVFERIPRDRDGAMYAYSTKHDPELIEALLKKLEG